MDDWYGETEVAMLKVGDEVGVTSGNHYSPPTIERITRRTATQVLAGSDRFNKRGSAVGGTTWRSRHLIAPSRARADIAEFLRRNGLALAQRYLRDFHWGSLTLEQCEKIKALLASFKEGATEPETRDSSQASIEPK